MGEAAIPPNEAERLRRLYELGLLDSAKDAAFDAIVRLAADICQVPIALISLIDRDRQWFKSSIGIDVTETPRGVAFCAHAILGETPLIVEDPKTDARFADNPFVTGDPHIQFYAGAPLKSKDGLNLGTLCVLDTVQRRLTPLQLHALEVLGIQVETLFALRQRNIELMHLQQQREELVSFIVHDLKNALANIMPNAEYASLETTSADDARLAARDILNASEQMSVLVTEALTIGRSDHAALELHLQELDVRQALRNVHRRVSRRAHREGKQVAYAEGPTPTLVHADDMLLRRVLENLLDNALKYGGNVTLSVEEAPSNVVLRVSDDGPGVPEAERERIFKKFERLAPQQSGSHGLGLAFCRIAVEALGGKIWVEPNQPRGSSFCVSLARGVRA